ncbi:MAG: hypothetical protein K2N64_00560 [Anaeroplasmataceae bacterium]|nr:hypothetical protein [Anaeroplasmataceae bacterium]
MKIAIIGFSGSGKSTLARRLSEFYGIDVLYLDTVQFKPNWVKRKDEEMTAIVSSFLENHEAWIIEGNYLRICEERFLEADVVIDLVLNRFVCLKNVVHRYHTFKHKTRPDMADGCMEKLDLEFLKWVFFKGRTRQKKKKHKQIIASAKSGYRFTKRKQVNEYLKELGVEMNEASM